MMFILCLRFISGEVNCTQMFVFSYPAAGNLWIELMK